MLRQNNILRDYPTPVFVVRNKGYLEMTSDHTIEQSLEEILRRLDSIAQSMLVIQNYFSEKGRIEFDHPME
jgi:hypothetical protein